MARRKHREGVEATAKQAEGETRPRRQVAPHRGTVSCYGLPANGIVVGNGRQQVITAGCIKDVSIPSEGAKAREPSDLRNAQFWLYPCRHCVCLMGRHVLQFSVLLTRQGPIASMSMPFRVQQSLASLGGPTSCS